MSWRQEYAKVNLSYQNMIGGRHAYVVPFLVILDNFLFICYIKVLEVKEFKRILLISTDRIITLDVWEILMKVNFARYI